MTSPNEPRLRVVADALDDAVPYVPEVAETAVEPMVPTDLDPPPGEPNHAGTHPGRWTPNKLGLPDDCPVTPLGVDGDVYYFLDTIGQLRALGAREFSKMSVLSLFMGRQHYLWWAWPRMSKEGKTTNFANDDVSACLMGACAAKGPWTPTDRVRGRGAWLGVKGDLIVHCGTYLYMHGRVHPTGEHGRYVYPKRPAALSPWPHRIDSEINPARVILPMLRKWKWKRPGVDPVLLLGWIGASMLGGALDWRPMVYLTGDRGTGKSTLQRVIRGLFGDGIISTANTTAAGIYQLVAQDSLPVAIDELEGSEDNRQAKKLLELARQASSGDKGLRGGDRGTGTEFRIQSTFLLSSILIPPMLPQDRSRFALLSLDKIDPSLPPPTRVGAHDLALLGRKGIAHDSQDELSAEDFARLGRMMLRRMIDAFPDRHAKLRAYREVLREHGHDQRGQDTFGSLLACADMMVGDAFDDLGLDMGETLSSWGEALAAGSIAELADVNESWLDCLNYLLGAPVEAWRNGAKATIGRQIVAYMDGEEGSTDSKHVRGVLEQAGVGLKLDVSGKWLAIPNSSPLLHRLFVGSRWAGDASVGLWSQALKHGPQGTLWESGHCRINGVNSRCTMISLDALYGRNGIMRGSGEDHDKMF